MHFEFVARLSASDRYAAHCEIDRMFASRARASRPWRYSVLDTEVDGYWALVRTRDASLRSEFSSVGSWIQHDAWTAGQDVDFWLQFTPKRASQRAALRMRHDDFEKWFLDYLGEQRLLLAQPSVQLLRQQVVSVRKDGKTTGVDSFLARTGHFRIQGRVVDAQAFNQAWVDGLGSLRAFGVGLPVMESGAMFDMAMAVAEL